MRSISFLSLLFVISGCVSEDTTNLPDGEVANIEKFRFMVSIHSVASKRYLCSGTIVGDFWILTTAYCVSDIRLLEVRIGSKYYNKEGHVFKVFWTHIHPKFNKVTKENDIALLQLFAPIQVSTRARRGEIAEANQLPYFGYNGTISGWIKAKSKDEQTALRYQKVEIIQCADEDLTQNIFCVKSIGQATRLQEDRGGPFIHDDIVFGVNVRTNSTHVYLFANVARYREWIESVFDVLR